MISAIRKKLFFSDIVCPSWLSFSLDTVVRKYIHDPENILAGRVREGMTVMDIGCGPGYFTIPMAALVGETGRVVAVDVQRKMLDRMLARARKAGLADRIVPRMATRHSLEIDEKCDFALAFWMVHEVPDKPAFFRQVREFLMEGASLLIAEPVVHVMGGDFEKTLGAARAAGFAVEPGPKVRLSRAAVLHP